MPDTPTWDTSRYYADPSDVAARLDVDPTDPVMLRRLAAATDRLISDIGHPLHLVTDDEHFGSGDGGPTLAVPATPIVGTPTIEIDDTPVTGVQIGRRTGLLWRDAGWPRGLENVRIVYTHGYATIPGDVQDVIIDAVEAAHSLDVGVEQVSTGGESVKFTAGLVNGGTTLAWGRVADKYRLTGNGDGE